MDHLYLEGKHVADGEKTMASVEFHHVRARGSLTRARRALRGWRKEWPASEPGPNAKDVGVWAGYAAVEPRTQGHGHGHQSDPKRLGEKHLVRPVAGAGAQFQWHAIIVRDFDEKRPDKVSVFDNTMALNTPERFG